MAVSRRQKTIIFDLSDVKPCSCQKVAGRFDDCCQLHRVLQLAPRCSATRRCINCFDKDYDTKVGTSISGDWVRAQPKIPQSIRDLYNTEMAKYGIVVDWRHTPFIDTDRYITEPLHLTPRAGKWPRVTVEYARHIRGMDTPKVDWSPGKAADSQPQHEVADAGALIDPADIKQEPEVVVDMRASAAVGGKPPRCPPKSEFHRGPDNKLYALDAARMILWECVDESKNSYGCRDLLKEPPASTVTRRPRRRPRMETETRDPLFPTADMDDDVIVTGCEPADARAIAKWINDTTALTTSTFLISEL